MCLLAVLTGDRIKNSRKNDDCITEVATGLGSTVLKTPQSNMCKIQSNVVLSINWLKNVSLVTDKTTDIHRLTLEA